MLSTAGHLAEVVALLAHLHSLIRPGSSVSSEGDGAASLRIKAFLVIHEFLELPQLRYLLLHLLLTLSRLQLSYLLVKLANSLKAAIAQLAMNVGAAGQHFQLIAEEQIVILTCCYLVENAAALGWLRDLDGVDGCEYLRPVLRSRSRCQHLST